MRRESAYKRCVDVFVCLKPIFRVSLLCSLYRGLWMEFLTLLSHKLNLVSDLTDYIHVCLHTSLKYRGWVILIFTLQIVCTYIL